MDYCNGVQGFINYALHNPRNINEDGIRCPCKRCKNKKFLDLDVVTMHLLQKNQGYVCQYPIVDEESNEDAARFFDLLSNL
jgi:hypothetical protein